MFSHSLRLSLTFSCWLTLSPYVHVALDLRSDVESVTARLRYLGEAHQTVKGDIALTKRATKKASVDVTKAQEEKLKQV